MGTDQRKTETINLRLSPKLKSLLRQAAAHEHRTISNMIEFLVIAYCEQHGIKDAPSAAGRGTPRASQK